MISHFTGRAVRFLLLGALTALMLTGFALAADAAELAMGVGATTGSSLRMRERPSTSAAVVATMDKGVQVAILDTSDRNWFRVAFDGKTGYVATEYLVVDSDNVFDTYGRVSQNSTCVYAAAGTDSELLTTLGAGTYLPVSGFQNGWYKVTLPNGAVGYIRSDFVELTTRGSYVASAAIAEAMKHLGTPYVYAGSAPGGFDCSGFTSYVYRQQDIELSRSATGQWLGTPGTRVYSIGELQPGDLVFFNDTSRSRGGACSHVGLYIGNSQFIHSSSPRSGGVIISSLYEGYYNRYFIGGIHL